MCAGQPHEPRAITVQPQLRAIPFFVPLSRALRCLARGNLYAMAGTQWITSTVLILRRCSRKGDYEAPSLFTPQNLLREARRQKGLPEGPVPAICVFDPDGDLVEFLQAAGHAHRHPTWARYHTVLETFVQDEIEYGIIGRVVGAPFATLVAEELFASGCQLLISITSAGRSSRWASLPM